MIALHRRLLICLKKKKSCSPICLDYLCYLYNVRDSLHFSLIYTYSLLHWYVFVDEKILRLTVVSFRKSDRCHEPVSINLRVNGNSTRRVIHTMCTQAARRSHCALFTLRWTVLPPFDRAGCQAVRREKLVEIAGISIYHAFAARGVQWNSRQWKSTVNGKFWFN